MTTETTATPRPWELDFDTGVITDADGQQIAGVRDSDFRNRPHARFILTAVNAHDALVAVARALAETDWGKIHLKALQGQARAALALAEPAKEVGT